MTDTSTLFWGVETKKSTPHKCGTCQEYRALLNFIWKIHIFTETPTENKFLSNYIYIISLLLPCIHSENISRKYSNGIAQGGILFSTRNHGNDVKDYQTICLSLLQVGGGVGSDPRPVCHRAGWVLLRSVHVQQQPRSPVYPFALCPSMVVIHRRWQHVLFPFLFLFGLHYYKSSNYNEICHLDEERDIGYQFGLEFMTDLTGARKCMSRKISHKKRSVLLNSNSGCQLHFHDSKTPAYASLFTIATGAHASASVALLFFLFEQWECDVYWWILAFCRLVCRYLVLSVLFFQKHYFPDRNWTQHWLSTAARPYPCLSLCLRSGNAGHIGWYLPSAGLCARMYLLPESKGIERLINEILVAMAYESM